MWLDGEQIVLAQRLIGYIVFSFVFLDDSIDRSTAATLAIAGNQTLHQVSYQG